MINSIAILCCVASLTDSVEHIDIPVPPAYTKQVIINGIIGVGFTATATVFYIKGNDAYDNYLLSDSLVEATAAWNKVQTYDTIRNVCAVGAALFLARALYYQFKNIKVYRSARITPILNFDAAYCSRINVGLESRF
jgi:hypothetical protein